MDVPLGAADVVGVGLATPAGRTPEAFWASLLAGQSATTKFSHSELPADVVIPVAPALCIPRVPLDSRSGHLDRTHVLAMAAADDALQMVPERPAPERCAVVCGVGYGSAGVSEEAHRSVYERGMRGLGPLLASTMMASSVAANLAMRFAFEGPCLTVSTACAAGADAIGQGLDLLRLGRADLVLAGGVDGMLVLSPILAMYRTGAMSRLDSAAGACRPFDQDRDGMVMGEGAGFVVLRRSDPGRSPGEFFGRVAGHASTCDAHHLLVPRADGVVASRCVRAALQDAGLGASDMGHINAHGTATKLNDAAEARVIRNVFGQQAPPVIAAKGATGHLIGGSGAVEAIVSLLAMREGILPPTAGLTNQDPSIDLDVVSGGPRTIATGGYALSQSFGFGGHNAALVLAGTG